MKLKLLVIPYNKNMTVEDYWQHYIKTIGPDIKPDSNQYRTMRLTFFAATASFFQHVGKLSAELGENDAMAYLDKMEKELEEYFHQLKSGYSGN